MEKKCLNCKWYYNNKCNNKSNINNLYIEDKNSTYWELVSYIEDGILSEQLREKLELKDLGKQFLKVIAHKEYIKKTCIKKASEESYELEEVEIYEYIEDLFSSMLMGYFKNKDNRKENIKINNPDNFYCCNWE